MANCNSTWHDMIPHYNTDDRWSVFLISHISKDLLMFLYTDILEPGTDFDEPSTNSGRSLADPMTRTPGPISFIFMRFLAKHSGSATAVGIECKISCCEYCRLSFLQITKS